MLRVINHLKTVMQSVEYMVYKYIQNGGAAAEWAEDARDW